MQPKIKRHLKWSTLIYGAIVVSLILAATYAVTVLSFHQDLTVPTSEGLEVYRNDGTTIIPEGSDQAGIWIWDGTTTRFFASIEVKNIGNTNITITITSTGLGAGWTLTTTGSLVDIMPLEYRAITLYATNPAAQGGDNTGDFTVTVAKV